MTNPASYIIKDTHTGKDLFEVSNTAKNRKAIAHLKPRYKAVPIIEHLESLKKKEPSE